MQILAELAKHLNTGAFLAGLISGIALSIAAVTVLSFVAKHWKATLLTCVIIIAASLAALAL